MIEGIGAGVHRELARRLPRCGGSRRRAGSARTETPGSRSAIVSPPGTMTVAEPPSRETGAVVGFRFARQQAVTHAGLGDQEAGAGRIGLELLAQLADVDP